MRRTRLVPYLVDAIGDDVARLLRLETGWPSLVEVATGSGPVRVSFHAAEAGRHSRFKDGVETAKPYEWRFQNPADKAPVARFPGSVVALVGHDLFDGHDILIAVDGRSRIGRAARYPILFDKRISREAAAQGWSSQTTASGETIHAMRPHLFPIFVELLKADVQLPVSAVVDAVEASGLLEGPDAAAAGPRARQMVSRLVRSRVFAKKIKTAYQHRCAMCRVGLGLVAGAHILPVTAPGAPDAVSNGLALCQNHHSAFDSFNIWVGDDYRVHIRPDWSATAGGQAESRRFLDETRPVLWVPRSLRNQPSPDMFARRYLYYEADYAWAARLR